MKKLWIVLVVSAFTMGCNNNSDVVDDRKDSVLDKIDSTTESKVDSLEKKADSVKSMVEGSFEKTDSANRATGDSTSKK